MRVWGYVCVRAIRAISHDFEKSWKTEEIPEDWKRTNIVTIYKIGNKDNLGNYRPVSLTSVLKDNEANN